MLTIMTLLAERRVLTVAFSVVTTQTISKLRDKAVVIYLLLRPCNNNKPRSWFIVTAAFVLVQIIGESRDEAVVVYVLSRPVIIIIDFASGSSLLSPSCCYDAHRDAPPPLVKGAFRSFVPSC